MIDRRDFLTRAAATGLAAALPLQVVGAAPSSSRVAGGVAADKWDLSWTQRLRGKSRAVFDSPAIGEGGALFRACMWREQLHDVMGTPKEEITPVVVFRHEGIPLIMNDSYWQRFNVGKEAKLRDQHGKKWAKQNPIGSAPPDAKPPWSEFNVPGFIANGGIVLACNLAFQMVVEAYRKKDKLSREDARKAALDQMIPGVILQPSGFFAVLKAQDEGCAYMMGS